MELNAEHIIDMTGTFLPFLPGLVAVVLGAWAFLVMRRPVMRKRADRSLAVRLIVVVGALVGVAGTVLVASAMVMFSSRSPDIVAGSPFGLAAALTAALAACFGYVAAARRVTGAKAVAGVLAGPAVLFVATVLFAQIGQTFTLASETAAEAQEVEAMAERSAALELSASDIVVETARGGEVVAAVRLQARLRAGTSIQIEPAAKDSALRFQLVPNKGADVGDQMHAVAPLGSPTALGPGIDATYAIEFRYEESVLLGQGGTVRPGVPGPWLLVASFVDVIGQEYRVEALVDIGG
jgi:hypothetical protein